MEFGKSAFFLHSELSIKQVDGVNMMSLLRKVRGKEQRAYTLLSMFSEKFKNVGQKIKSALESEDFDRAARLVHSLKGSSGNLEAEDIYRLTIELEQVLLENNGYYYELLDRLDVCLESVNDSISEILSEQQNSHTHDKDHNVDFLKLQVDELHKLLGKRNMRAVKLFEELSPCFQHSLSAQIYGQLDMHIRSLKFDMAIKDLKHIEHIIKGYDD